MLSIYKNCSPRVFWIFQHFIWELCTCIWCLCTFKPITSRWKLLTSWGDLIACRRFMFSKLIFNNYLKMYFTQYWSQQKCTCSMEWIQVKLNHSSSTMSLLRFKKLLCALWTMCVVAEKSEQFEGLLVLLNKKVNRIVLHLFIDYTNCSYDDISKILFSPRNILLNFNFQQMGTVWHSFWSNNLLYKPHIPVVYKLYLNYQ